VLGKLLFLWSISCR